jgi:ABC-type nitrate/sulfonate/bicarbonate transport system permease component
LGERIVPETLEASRVPVSAGSAGAGVASVTGAAAAIGTLSRRPGGRGRLRRILFALGPSWRRGAISVGAVLVFLLVWVVIARFAVREEIILPTPAAVIRRFGELMFSESGQMSLWPNLTASLLRVLAGWAIGLVGGVALGVLMASSAVIRAAVDPLLEAGRAIPPLALAPLLLVWFGIGETSKVLLLTFAAFPVFAVSTTAAITGVDESLRRAALTLGAGRIHMVRRVVLPSVLPELFTAMRLASAFAWTTLVAAELVAATNGLGWMILQAGRYLDTPTIFVGIVTIGVVAFLMDRVLRILERRFVPWKGKA